MTTHPGSQPEPPDELSARLDRWVAGGLITAEQARRIEIAEQAAAEAFAPTPGPAAAAAPPQRTGPLVTEALAYVGGVLILVAAGTIAGRYWSSLGEGGRLAILFGAAALLLATGAAVPRRLGAAAERLRGVSWLLSAALFAGGMLLLLDMTDLREERGMLFAMAATSAYSAVLWSLHRSVLQQVPVVVALAVTTGFAVGELPGGEIEVIGLAVWGVGAVWMLLGWGGVIRPDAAAYILGGAVAVVGAQLTLEAGWGSWLAIGSAVLLVAAGVALRDLVLLGVGSVATLVAVPVVLDRLFPDTLTAPVAVLVLGAALVLGALYTARRRARRQVTDGQGRGRVTTVVGAGVAAAVGLVVLVAVLVAGAS